MSRYYRTNKSDKSDALRGWVYALIQVLNSKISLSEHILNYLRFVVTISADHVQTNAYIYTSSQGVFTWSGWAG